jgi:hypothetical protein
MHPDGSWLTGWTSLLSTTFVEPYMLPATETVRVIMTPDAAGTGSLTMKSYDVPADVTDSLTINGGTVSVALSGPGQNALVSFPGTAGTPVTLRLTNNTYLDSSVKGDTWPPPRVGRRQRRR